jgi:DNA-binding transcriptional MerR regulator/methylmalonyl-CoA mutase cobalamin-binding subunit
MAAALLRIGELSRRTGLSVDVIRAWERRYDLLRPSRTAGNFRLYSQDDISRLRLMQHYLSKGLPTAQAAGLVHRVQTAALDANPGLPVGDARKAVSALSDSLERFDDAPASRTLERLLGVFPPGTVLRDVVLPYLRGLGERWERGQVTVSQEHFASGFLESWMLSMTHGWAPSGTRRAVLACVPGDRHTLGLVACGLALRELGWRITYLGADTPLAAVDHAADSVDADAIVLASALTGAFAAGGDLRDLARKRLVCVGGAGVAENRATGLASLILPTDPIVAANALTVQLSETEKPFAVGGAGQQQIQSSLSHSTRR